MPKKGIYDNEAARSPRHGGRAEPDPTRPLFDTFRGLLLGIGMVICRPADPRPRATAGLVERGARPVSRRAPLAAFEEVTVDAQVTGSTAGPARLAGAGGPGA